MEFKVIYAVVTVKVLIESDWNLKHNASAFLNDLEEVLIESDWNLKYVARIKSVASASINRIRLEFKEVFQQSPPTSLHLY